MTPATKNATIKARHANQITVVTRLAKNKICKNYEQIEHSKQEGNIPKIRRALRTKSNATKHKKQREKQFK